MEYEIEFFGMIAEKLGKESEQQIANADCVGKRIMDEMIRLYPTLQGMTFSCAVDNVLRETFPEGKWNKIAILPPFAGG